MTGPVLLSPPLDVLAELPPIGWGKLAEPFRQSELEWKPQTAGVDTEGAPYVRLTAYIQARAVFARLDEVATPDRWAIDYRETELQLAPGETSQQGRTHRLRPGLVCTLSILGSHGWIHRQDAVEIERRVDGENRPDPWKTACSGAVKRCAVLFGMGRYLYEIPALFGLSATVGKPKAEQRRDPRFVAVKYEEGVRGFCLAPLLPDRYRHPSERGAPDL